jgi:aryl-alcohol dehydrogenase-like predicted oxidoreductase
MKCEKLILGTAQFGRDYGVANRTGKVSYQEIERILDKAQAAGCEFLDTAGVYGDAETVLGDLGVGAWKVISKVIVPREAKFISSKFLQDVVEMSLDRLKINKLYSLLIHNTEELDGDTIACVLRQGEDLKNNGLIESVGLSVYSNFLSKLDQAEHLVSIIQAPYNPFDHRVKEAMVSNTTRQFELHVRSIFLQGILLMQPVHRPSYFKKWSKELSAWDAFVSESKHSAQAICLNHALSSAFINKVVIGVDSFNQFNELIYYYNLFKDYVGSSFESEELGLIDPFRWRL